MMPVSVCLSVCLSVTEVHWHIIANLGFKVKSDPTLLRIAAAVLLAGAVLLAMLLAGRSSRAMLASARLSCYLYAFGCRYIECVTLGTADTILVTKTPTSCGEICDAVCSILVVVKFSMWTCQSCSGFAEVMYLLHLKYMHMYTSSHS